MSPMKSDTKIIRVSVHDLPVTSFCDLNIHKRLIFDLETWWIDQTKK